MPQTKAKPKFRRASEDFARYELTLENGSKVELSWDEARAVYRYFQELGLIGDLEDAFCDLTEYDGSIAILCEPPIRFTDEQRDIFLLNMVDKYSEEIAECDAWKSHATHVLTEALEEMACPERFTHYTTRST